MVMCFGLCGVEYYLLLICIDRLDMDGIDYVVSSYLNDSA